MKLIVKFFLILGLLFWGAGFIYSLSNLIALNGMGNFFKVEKPEIVETKMERDSLDVNIYYTYEVNRKKYNSDYKMVKGYFEKCNVDCIVIMYNTKFPMVSYIEGIPLKNRKQKTGILISLFFFLFLLLVWKLSNRKKWVKTYEEVGKRPWLYSDDKTIKNPWKRIMNRLFRKV